MRLAAAIAIAIASGIASARTGVRAEDQGARALQAAMGMAQRGLASLEKGNTARAREDLEKAIAKVPGLPEAHMGLGHLAMRERRFDDALREYRRAQEGHREIAALLLQMSTDRYAKSRDELAHLRVVKNQLDVASTSNDRTGGNSENVNSLGLRAGQVERERADIDRRITELESMDVPNPATAKDPPARLFFFEGNALFDLQRLDEAITAWEEAVRRDPKFAPVRNNLAVAYWRKGRIGEAQAALDRAAALGFQVNPNFRQDLARAAASPPESP